MRDVHSTTPASVMPAVAVASEEAPERSCRSHRAGAVGNLKGLKMVRIPACNPLLLK